MGETTTEKSPEFDWLSDIVAAIQDLSRNMQAGESGEFESGYAYGIIRCATRCGYLSGSDHDCFSNLIDTIYHKEQR